MKDLKILTYCCPTKMYLGINAHKKLSEIIDGFGVKHLFFLSDNGVTSTEIFTLVKSILEEHHVTFDLFTDIEPDPSHKTVEKAFGVYQKNKKGAFFRIQ